MQRVTSVSSDGVTAQITGNWSEALPDKQQGIALEALLNGNLVSEETKVLASQPDISAMLAFFFDAAP
ncbi:hypothetical protein P4S72_23465 [Vibrio sp. PP-XX7]